MPIKIKPFKSPKIIAIFFIAFQAINLPATTLYSWQGIVTNVTDGDTLRVRPIGLQGKMYERKIRIDGIDAPDTSKFIVNGHMNSLLDQGVVHFCSVHRS